MLENRYRHPKHEARPHTPLHELLAQAQLSEVSRSKYRLVLDQWIRFAGADSSNWTRQTMVSWRASLIKREMSQATIKTYLASLQHISKWWSETYGGTHFAYVQPIRIPTAAPIKREPPKPHEVEALLATCFTGKPNLYDFRDLTLMIVGFDTGMRRHSLANMMWEKIGDLSTGPNGPYPSAIVPVKGKGGQLTFKVPLSEICLEALEAWRTAIGGTRSGFVFRRLLKRARRDGQTAIKITGQGLSDISIYEIFQKRGEQIGLHMFPHLVRHFYVSYRYGVVDTRLIAAVTGHTLEALLKAKIGKIDRYIAMEMAGDDGRKTTPTWFAQLARRRIREMQDLVS